MISRSLILLIGYCLSSIVYSASALQSPRGTELFSGAQMNVSTALMPNLIAPPLTNSLSTNSFGWNGSLMADGYILHQWSGTITNQYPTPDTSVTIVYSWPDSVDRWHYVATATNNIGESGPSNEITDPPMPPTHVIISWQSIQRQKVYEYPSIFSRMAREITNGFSPITLPIKPGSRWFGGGTNQIVITATRL